MNRLQFELHRLYAAQPAAGQDGDLCASGLIDAAGQVRAMVLELARPADWAALSPVWQGVQADLDLPAPAIAVNGSDGYQLWFSLAEPVPAVQALAFLDALRLRYLGDVRADRLTLLPALDAAAARPAQHVGQMPPAQVGDSLWSAFVAPDLAPVFADEPWLDMTPNVGGQSDLLARLHSIHGADFQRVLALLVPAAAQSDARPLLAVPAAPTGTQLEPKRFLLDVMNDTTVALGLRIEAAKALLPYCTDPPRR